jgi:hypothetical protein
VVLGADGLASKVDLISGHPLLVDAAKRTIRKWKSLPLEGPEVEFQLACNFAFNGMVSYDRCSRSFASGPHKLSVESSESPVEQSVALLK